MSILGDDDDNTLVGTDDNDQLLGFGGDDSLSGLDGNDELRGNVGDDTIDGGPGADELFGFRGNDDLRGGPGDDVLRGGPDDDNLRGGGGNDINIGGDGVDTADFSDIGADVSADLNSGQAVYQGPAGVVVDELRGIENLTGSSNDDTLTGDRGDNVLDGGAGGNDDLDGQDGNDLLIGRGGADTLRGGEGDDVIRGGGGQDVTDGGPGNDTDDFSDIGAPVVADLAQGLASYMPNANVTIVEQTLNFENFIGTANGDQLFGDGGANTLQGGDGDDLLEGRGGGDLLEGGAGDDLLRGSGGNDTADGGEGIDTADFTDIGTPVTANLNTGVATYQGPAGPVTDTLIDIENLTGSMNDDRLIGDAGDNLLAGAGGDDELRGGAGDDVLRGDEIGDGSAIVVTVENLLGEGGTFLTPVWFGFHDGSSFDLFDVGAPASTGLERLAEDGVVAPISAEFVAQAGENGIDSTVFGPGGVPGPIDPGETASAVLNVNPDLVGQGFFTWATMVIPSNDAFLAVPDDAFADPIFDADGNFLGPIVIERSGADVLDAGTEVNNEIGAAFLDQTALDEGTPEGGTVQPHPGFNGSAGNPLGAPVNILSGAAVTASGAPIDPSVADFTLDDDLLLRITITQLTSEGGDDDLRGGNGNDRLEGGGGDDELRGGNHDDRLEGGSGNDILRGDNGEDELLGGTGSDTLVGGRGDDLLIGGGGADTLNGSSGDDVLRGGGGDDVLRGSSGRDTADFSDIGFDVTADLDAGSASYVTPGGVVTDQFFSIENLIGSELDDDLFGNSFRNEIAGGAGSDIIDGRGGADTLGGGLDQDTLTGGNGGDTFQFTVGEGAEVLALADIVTDFDDDADSIDVLLGGGGPVELAIDQTQNVTGDDELDTVISVVGSGEAIAVLDGINALNSDFDLNDINVVA